MIKGKTRVLNNKLKLFILVHALISILISACTQDEKAVGKEVFVAKRFKDSVDILNSAYNVITDYENFSGDPATIETLMIGRGDLQNENDLLIAVKRCYKLKALYIYDHPNLNSEILFDNLKTTKNLDELHLRHCNIILTGELRELKQVKHLVLDENNLKIIPFDLINNLNLNKLEIIENNFNFSGNLTNGKSIKYLSISGLNQDSLDSEIYKMVNINTLIVLDSKLKFISKDIVKLKKLKELWLVNTPLSRNIKGMQSLRKQLYGKSSVSTENDIELAR